MKEIARREAVSAKYLEQIMARLRVAGLVVAHRGMQGGYALAGPPASITLREVYQILEGATAPVECVDDPDSCPMGDVCPTRDTWVELKESIENVLKSTTLRDLVERKRRKGAPSAPLYHI